jgi:Fe-Mn family superoxide dismutase
MQNAPIKGTPILCLDLWEHAYISENQINKTNYVDYFFETINWDVIMRRYQTAINL